MKTIAIILAAVGLSSAGVIPVPADPSVNHVAFQYRAPGGYPFVNGNGLFSSVPFVADPLNGVRISAPSLSPASTMPVVGPVVSFAEVPVPVIAGNPPTFVKSEPAYSVPSTVVASAVSQLKVDQNPPAPVVEKVEDEAVVVDVVQGGETPAENQDPVKQQPVATAGETLITPVQDTAEVQAARAAHLATFEQVKLRDAAQEIHDAQENSLKKTEETEENSEGEESTEASSEGTEAPASETEEHTPAEPAQVLIPESPVRSEPAPSVVATDVTPAAQQGVVPVQVVPNVIVKDVLAASAPVFPAAVAAPVVGTPSGPVALEHVGQITSQYHSQDELGQYSYGYSGGPSAKHELKTVDGLTSGGYSYIDSHGLVQTAAYVSDPVNGFRVAATNIPKQREPEYIADSPDVEVAKQKLFQAQAEHIAKL